MKSANETSRRVCPLCDTDNCHETPLSLSFEEWRLKSCRSCGLVYLENPPSYAALENEFAWEKSFEVEARRRARRQPLTRRFTRLAAPLQRWIKRKRRLPTLVDKYVGSGRIIDVGCGRGNSLVAIGADYELYGIEISPDQAQQARRSIEPLGGKLVQADAVSGLAVFPDSYFHGAVMHAYLEHEVHPKHVLEETWRVLRPGGHLVVKVPNFACILRRLRGRDWCGLRFPDHVSYFTPETLQDLLNRSGFHTAQFRVTDRLPTSDNMWCVFAKQTASLAMPTARLQTGRSRAA